MTARPDLVYGAVLAAALLHAGCNALAKRSADSLLRTTDIAAAAAGYAHSAHPCPAAPVDAGRHRRHLRRDPVHRAALHGHSGGALGPAARPAERRRHRQLYPG